MISSTGPTLGISMCQKIENREGSTEPAKDKNHYFNS